MANTVSITFAGDSRNLERAFDRVGAAAKRMQKSVEKSAADSTKSMKGFNLFGKDSSFVSSLKKLPSLVGDTFSSLPMQAQAPIVAAGAAVAALFAAPIAAGVTAAVLMAVGGGVLAAGIAAAARDPRVKAAWAPVVASARSAFDKLGQHFVGPLERAAAQFQAQADKLSPMADRLGAVFAPVIDRLSPAFASMAEKIMPSLERAAIASVPLFDKLAEKAPAIADAVARFFDVMADNGPAAEKFLERFLDIVVFVIDNISTAINFLAKLYKTGEDLFTRWKGGVRLVGDAFGGLWESFKANLNRIIGAWNGLSFTLGGGNVFGMDIPRFTLSTPDIPKFHQCPGE